MVICTIHQPSTSLFNLFDDVVLLTKGQCAYSGPRTLAPAHFEQHGCGIPAFTNPADHYLEVINFDFSQGQQMPEKVRNLMEGLKKAEATSIVNEHIKHIKSDKFQSEENTAVYEKYINGWSWQVYVLCLRGFMNALKDPAEYWARVLMYLLVRNENPLFLNLSSVNNILFH